MRASMLTGSRFHCLMGRLLTELAGCWQHPAAEVRRLEAAFVITRQHCEQLRYDCFRTPFTGEAEEMLFYKHVQPQFCGTLLYYTILYEALLVLTNSSKHPQVFWAGESRRFVRFAKNNTAFMHYMDSGATHHDTLYFLQRCNTSPERAPSTMYNCGNGREAARSYQAVFVFAEKNYHAYVQNQLMLLDAQ